MMPSASYAARTDDMTLIKGHITLCGHYLHVANKMVALMIRLVSYEAHTSVNDIT